MSSSSIINLRAPLARPLRGASTRVQLGGSELVLECVRGGHSLLWTNGRQARRFVLGLPAHGELVLELRAPKLLVCVVPREEIAVAPGGRVAGYLQVSLVPTLVWQDAAGPRHTVIELAPDDQVAEWDEQLGHALHTSSPWCVRFPMRSGEPRAVVPVRVGNRSDRLLTPASFDLRLRDAELRPLRGSLVVPPRRFEWAGERWNSVVRGARREVPV